jgi:GH35 family endo-1,4-beta-xylanase
MCAIGVGTAYAQTTLNGSSLAMKSTGSGSGTWTLDRDGYVGTYINVATAGNVTVRVNANGTASGGVAPHMNIVLADTKPGFDVTSGLNPYEYTFNNMPAGTYFLRTEFNNDVAATSRALAIQSVTVTGATVLNSSTNANALAAADTYIQNFRKGNVNVGLSGLAPGTNVELSLKRHAFNFGTAVAGNSASEVNAYLGSNSNPASTAYKYQQAMAASKFNSIVPENAGKWGNNATSATAVNMSGVDAVLNFAEAKNLRVRMHNLIWGSQQPSWVNTLLTDAANGSATAATSAATLRNEISERIAYYVGSRAQRYADLDVYNETIHTPQYWNVYQASGIAGIYNEVAAALPAGDNNTKLFTNEYNVLQDDGNYYGNPYLQNIESILAQNGNVGGIGIQSYENNAIGTTFDAHYPARKMQTLQNLSVLGKPIVLTEFGVKDPTSAADASTMMEDTVRLVFGTPDATGFFMWGFWRGNIYRGAVAFYDTNWNLTTAGDRWQDLLSLDSDGDANDDWDTQLSAVPVGPDGTINFNGYWGDYEVKLNNQTIGTFTLNKGTAQYSVVIAPGDYNGDHVVDAQDYIIWRRSNGSTTDLRADGNGDRMINDSDFDIWKSHFGVSYGSGTSLASQVPEPGSVAPLVIAGLLLNTIRRAGSRHSSAN